MRMPRPARCAGSLLVECYVNSALRALMMHVMPLCNAYGIDIGVLEEYYVP